MYYIDPHIHMVSRVTDDYETLAKMGCVARERAGVLGRVRSRQRRRLSRLLPPAHRVRAEAGRLVRHRSTTPGCASTPRRRRTSSLSREVIAMIPEFLDRPGVLGIGEIGLNKNTAQRGDRLPGAPRPGREDRRADPDPHAAPGRQVPGHADDPRHALRRSPHRPQPGAGRPRRGAHDPRRCWTTASGPA